MESKTLLNVYGKDPLLEMIFRFFKNLDITDIPLPEKELLESENEYERLANVVLATAELFYRRGAGEIITVQDVQKLIRQQLQR